MILGGGVDMWPESITHRLTAVFSSNLARPNYTIGYPVLDE